MLSRKLHLVISLFFLSTIFSTVTLAEDIRLAPPLKKQKPSSPNAGKNADILYSIHRLSLDKQGYWTNQDYYSIKINDIASARDYGRIAYSFNDYYYDATLEFANVLTRDGEIKAVSPDAVQVRKGGSSQDFYTDESEIVFSLPQVEPGSTIEFQLKTHTRRLAMDNLFSNHIFPHWFQRYEAQDGWRADSVNHFSLEVNFPKSIQFHTKAYGQLANKPARAEKEDINSWRWEAHDLAALALEGNSPPGYSFIPSLLLSTDDSWANISSWTQEQFSVKPDEIKRLNSTIKAMSLAKNATDIDKIKAVYRFMQKHIRYVFAHLNRGGYTPHLPSEVLENRYGDCKDQTMLAVTLLRKLGIEAYPVLIQTPQSGKADTALARLIFDHVLVWIPANTEHKEIWLDTTNDHGLFPGVSDYLHGQPALILNRPQGTLVNANFEADKNIAEIDLRYRLNKAQQIVATVRFNFSGTIESNMRNWWKYNNNRETSLNGFLTTLFPDTTQYELTSKTFNADDIFAPFTIEGEFTFHKSSAPDEPIMVGTSVIQLMQLFAGLSSYQVPDARKGRYVTKSTVTYKAHTTFDAPKLWSSTLIQSAKNITNPFFNITQDITPRDNGFVVDISYTQPELDLSLTEYTEFYTDLMNLRNSDEWIISMQPNPDEIADSEVSQTENEKGGHSYEYQLALAKRLMEKGDFEEALVAAKLAVQLNKQNAEAWFVLGSAQGFIGEFDASKASFYKAKDLGYIP